MAVKPIPSSCRVLLFFWIVIQNPCAPHEAKRFKAKPRPAVSNDGIARHTPYSRNLTDALLVQANSVLLARLKRTWQTAIGFVGFGSVRMTPEREIQLSQELDPKLGLNTNEKKKGDIGGLSEQQQPSRQVTAVRVRACIRLLIPVSSATTS